MKDMQDGFREDAKYDPKEVGAAHPKGKDEKNDEVDQDSKKSEPIDRQGNETESQADGGQEKGASAQGEAAPTEESYSAEEGTAPADPLTGSKQYACQYTPPYYVPDFTVVDETEGERHSHKKKKEKEK